MHMADLNKSVANMADTEIAAAVTAQMYDLHIAGVDPVAINLLARTLTQDPDQISRVELVAEGLFETVDAPVESAVGGKSLQMEFRDSPGLLNWWVSEFLRLNDPENAINCHGLTDE